MTAAKKTSVQITQNATLFGAPEACKYLGVSRPTLYKLIQLKELPAFRIFANGPWKFQQDDLDEWLMVQKHRSIERRVRR